MILILMIGAAILSLLFTPPATHATGKYTIGSIITHKTLTTLNTTINASSKVPQMRTSIPLTQKVAPLQHITDTRNAASKNLNVFTSANSTLTHVNVTTNIVQNPRTLLSQFAVSGLVAGAALFLANIGLDRVKRQSFSWIRKTLLWLCQSMWQFMI
jgi:hypothetical protein